MQKKYDEIAPYTPGLPVVASNKTSCVFHLLDDIPDPPPDTKSPVSPPPSPPSPLYINAKNAKKVPLEAYPFKPVL